MNHLLLTILVPAIIIIIIVPFLMILITGSAKRPGLSFRELDLGHVDSNVRTLNY
jgi:hypothetical protein